MSTRKLRSRIGVWGMPLPFAAACGRYMVNFTRPIIRAGRCWMLALVMFGLGSTACTRLQPLVYRNEGDVAAKVTPQTKLHIVTMDGKKHELRAPTVRNSGVSGKESGRDVEIPLADVETIDLRVSAPGRTAMLVGLLATSSVLIQLHQCDFSIYGESNQTCSVW